MLQPKLSGPWSALQIKDYLNETPIPLRLSVISPKGWPIIVSLWFVFEKNEILCASKRQSKIIKCLENNPRCAFEISGETPPYSGVRGQGIAFLREDDNFTILERLHDRFLGEKNTPFRRWLLENSNSEVIVSIKPERLMTWDYRTRMSKSD